MHLRQFESDDNTSRIQKIEDYSLGLRSESLPAIWYEANIKASTSLILETFKSVTPSEKEAIPQILNEIFSRFSQDKLAWFCQFTLPLLLHRTYTVKENACRQFLNSLNKASEAGILDVSLPVLLKALPNRSYWDLTSRLHAIAQAVGDSREVVLNEILPRFVTEFDKKFGDSDFYAFHTLALTAGNQAPVFCNILLNRPHSVDSGSSTSAEGGLLLASDATLELNRRSAASCLEFCCEITSLLEESDSPIDNFTAVFESVRNAWLAWEPYHREIVGELLIDLLKECDRELPVYRIKTILKDLTIDSYNARDLLQGAAGIGTKGGSSAIADHIKLLSNIIKTGGFPEENVESLSRYFATASILRIRTYAEDILKAFTKTFGPARTSEGLDSLIYTIEYSTPEELGQIRSDLKINPLGAVYDYLTHTSNPIHHSVTNRMVMRFLLQDPFNTWKITDRHFDRRLENMAGFTEEPAYKLPPDTSIIIPVASNQKYMEFKPGFIDNDKKLAGFKQFMIGRREAFTYPGRAQEERIFSNICALLNKDYDLSMRGSKELVLELMVEASKQGEKLFTSVSKLAFPLLASATETRIARFDENNITPEQAHAFLDSLKKLIDDRLPVTLGTHMKMEREYVDLLKKISSLEQIENYLKRIAKLSPTGMSKIELHAAKNSFFSFYDLMGQTCVVEKYGNDMKKGKIQPIAMSIPSDLSIGGCWYTTQGTVRGVPSLFMAGGGPKSSLLKLTDVYNFARATKEYFAKVVDYKENNFMQLVAAVGAPTEARRYTNQGQISQFDDLTKALIGNAEIIELAPEEYIHFPSEFEHGPISHVAILYSKLP